LFLVLVAGIGLLVLVATATDWWVNHFADQEPAVLATAAQVETPDPATPDSLRVVSYNIKFGGGRIDFWFDCIGYRKRMEPAEVEQNMARVAELIRKLNPDILLVQEADWESDRVAGMNQIQYLLDHTELNYAAYASQWDVAWVPNGLGAVNSGNAVLSRYPMLSGMRHKLPQMQQQDAPTQLFYLRRNVLEVLLQLPGGDTLVVLNAHLEAYDKDGTRKQQLQILQTLAETHRAAGRHLVLGGDLNTMPPGTTQWHQFADEHCQVEEFQTSTDSTELTWLQPMYDAYREIVPLAQYHANQSRYFTHSVDGRVFWNRRLDYLFTNRWWRNGQVYQKTEQGGYETMPISDHCPIAGTLILQEPVVADSTENVN
jgi:endonuclease/exonuclease/phosphatase family metal-dependent hydrolase